MIDLHTHTNCSDGTDSPRELVNKAIVQGLEVLGIPTIHLLNKSVH